MGCTKKMKPSEAAKTELDKLIEKARRNDMGRLFGTDGIRGIANRDLSLRRATEVGMALAEVIRSEHPGERPGGCGGSAAGRPPPFWAVRCCE